MKRATKAETEAIIAERDWWRDLASRCGMRLRAWDGLPKHGCGASWIAPSGAVIDVPGELASGIWNAIHEKR
jgi:hypothetical protein